MNPEPDLLVEPAAAGQKRRRIGLATNVFGIVPTVRTERRAGDALRVVIAVLMLLGISAVVHVAGSPLGTQQVPDRPDGLLGLATLARVAGVIGVVSVVLVVLVIGRSVRLLVDIGLAIGLAVLLAVVARILLDVIGTGTWRPFDLDGDPSDQLPTLVAGIVAVASTAAPFLTRPARRLMGASAVLSVVGFAVYYEVTLISVLAIAIVGWMIGAIVHLVIGSPTGTPSAQTVGLGAADLGVDLADIELSAFQDWGVARFHASLASGEPVAVTVYGRDAADAGFLSRTWRVLWFRDGADEVRVSRRSQVEHEALLTMLAVQGGASVPAVVAVGLSASTEDALLVESGTDGTPLVDLDPLEVTDEIIDAVWAATSQLHDARIVHRALDDQHLIVGASRVSIIDLRRGSANATDTDLARDRANLLVTLALIVGEERAVASLVRAVGSDDGEAMLTYLVGPALSSYNRRRVRRSRGLLSSLRTQAAEAFDVERPETVELRRITVQTVLFTAATLLGFWLLMGQFRGEDDLWGTLTEADTGWIVVVFLMSLLLRWGHAYALTGAVTEDLPYGPVVVLQYGLAFTGLIGGTVTSTATIVRFFQQRGIPAAAAVSSSLILSFSGFLVQLSLIVTCLFFVPIDFGELGDRISEWSSGTDLPFGLILGLFAAAIALVGVALLLPRMRRAIGDKVTPHASVMIANVRSLTADPRRTLRIFVGSLIAQVLFAVALGAAVHATGYSVPLTTLLLIVIGAGFVGGVSPVPGGMGVVEATLVAGLTAAGVPESEALASVLIYRIFTSYASPAWGYPALLWLRHRDYL